LRLCRHAASGTTLIDRIVSERFGSCLRGS
jgi:hypothetical protein